MGWTARLGPETGVDGWTTFRQCNGALSRPRPENVAQKNDRIMSPKKWCLHLQAFEGWPLNNRSSVEVHPLSKNESICRLTALIGRFVEI
jgi:hypothetical protein